MGFLFTVVVTGLLAASAFRGVLSASFFILSVAAHSCSMVDSSSKKSPSRVRRSLLPIILEMTADHFDFPVVAMVYFICFYRATAISANRPQSYKIFCSYHHSSARILQLKIVKIKNPVGFHSFTPLSDDR
jgi:hypothetical protein